MVDRVLSSPEPFVVDNDYVKLPKIRDLNDFVYDQTRYSFPNHGDGQRLNNRIVNNLQMD